MANIDLKKDKSWFVIFALFFLAPPLGIIVLIGKVIYMVVQGQQGPSDDDRSFTKGYKRTGSSGSYSSSTEWKSDQVQENLEQIEDELMESFSHWKEKREEVRTEESMMTERDIPGSKAFVEYDRKGMPVTIEGQKTALDIRIDDKTEESPIGMDAGIHKDEDYLKVPDAPESVSFDYDVDLTFNDVHIDTQITFEGQPEDHHHGEGEPLKILTCTMCGTENKIYKVDRFETPTCEKCGMLLLER